MTTQTSYDDLTRVLEEAHAKHEETGAALREPEEHQKATLAIAMAAGDEREALAARRGTLIAQASTDPAAFDELAQIEAHMAAATQREIHAREAADHCTAAIARLAPAHIASARALLEANHTILTHQHAAEGEALREVFFALQPRVEAWLASAKHFDEQRHAVHGVWIRADNDGPFRVMRAWTVWSRELFGRILGVNNVSTLSERFPMEAGRLDTQI